MLILFLSDETSYGNVSMFDYLYRKELTMIIELYLLLSQGGDYYYSSILRKEVQIPGCSSAVFVQKQDGHPVNIWLDSPERKKLLETLYFFQGSVYTSLEDAKKAKAAS